MKGTGYSPHVQPARNAGLYRLRKTHFSEGYGL
jgi:hypothetical protein